MKTTKIYLFLLPPFPSQDGGVGGEGGGWGGGGGDGCYNPPTPQLFSWQKYLKNLFIDTWVSGQRVGKLTVRQS